MNTFVWDKDYDNTEQVRPYLADFMALKNDGTHYNADFEGKIPGLIGSIHEKTGIYLLQTLADLEKLKEKTQSFIESGGYRLSDRLPKETERGTLVHTGFYMGGTGWSQHQNAKVTVLHEAVRFKLPRQKNWRTHYDSPGSYLFKPE